MPYLRVMLPNQEKKLHELKRQATLIGRSTASDVALPDPLLADIALQIDFTEKGYYVSALDPGSKFLINGKPSMGCLLTHRDRLRIGSSELVFLRGNARRRAKRLSPRRVYRKLLSFSGRLAGRYDLAEILDVFLDSAIALAGADTGFLLLLADGKPEIPAARTGQREKLGDPAEQLSDSIIATVVSTRQPLLIPEIRRSAEYLAAPSIERLGLTSVMCLPLLEREHLLGVLYIGTHRRRQGVQPASLEPVTVLAAQGALLIRHALLTRDLRLDNERLAVHLEGLRYGALIGACPSMQEIFHRIERVAASEVPVLITGEQGTGKGLVAREIHARSMHAGGPFVTVHCSGVNEEGLANELFGHASVHRGETGGALARSIGGTLLIKDVGELPCALQRRLLSFLDEQPVGGSGSAGTRAVRLVATARHDLREAVVAGRFQEALYLRLNGTRLELPPLRERAGELLLLARYFLDRTAKETGAPVKGFSPEAVKAMKRYGWPGNIRQFETTIRQAVVATRNVFLGPEELGLHLSELPPILPLDQARERFEREYVAAVLDLCDGNRSRAAEVLGIHRRTLYRHLEAVEVEERTN